MRKPTNEQIRLACLWLDCNEDDGEAGQAIQNVSEWLKNLVEKSVHESVERQLKRKLTEEEKETVTQKFWG